MALDVSSFLSVAGYSRDDSPTKKTPKNIVISEAQWWEYCFFFKNIRAISAVIITIVPLIIWYTLAAVIVRAMFNKVDPIISQQAGMASKRGFMLVFSCNYYAT